MWRRFVAFFSPPEASPRGLLQTELVIFSVGVRDLQAELAKAGRRFRFDGSELAYDDADVAVQFTDYSFRLMNVAQTALNEGDVVSFWRYLAAAKHAELVAWESFEGRSDRLRLRAQQVYLAAVSDLPADQTAAVSALLLDDDDRVRPDVTADDVYAAIRLVHEWQIERSRRGDRTLTLERQFVTFLSVTVLALGGILASFGMLGTLDAETTTPALLVTAVLFGVLGAATSGILSLSDVLGTASVPDHVGTIWLSVGRLVVGGAAALSLVVFFIAGIFELVFRIDSASPSLLLAVAFVGGFSERLLVRAVEAVTGDAA
ncbi:hypothetical protein [Halogeometricum limi]|uniref:hypothetical protein n=1 Tax=Halogeometricum limi TaxID=555875 RepID=UPI000B7F6F3F|nr:hypothetical protein [Halogeometricum limi]